MSLARAKLRRVLASNSHFLGSDRLCIVSPCQSRRISEDWLAKCRSKDRTEEEQFVRVVEKHLHRLVGTLHTAMSYIQYKDLPARGICSSATEPRVARSCRCHCRCRCQWNIHGHGQIGLPAIFLRYKALALFLKRSSVGFLLRG